MLLVGENSIHDFDATAPTIADALGERANVTVSTDCSELEDPSAYDVVADYVTDSRLADAQLSGLASFVADGGGYLPIHCAADLTSHLDEAGEFVARDEPVPELLELIGGYFLDHPEQSTFGVRVVDADHPVVDGVSDFEVFDEPYQVAVEEERIRVLAWMDHPDLDEAYPVVWVREHGAGRVCYSSLGHTDAALEHEQHRRLLSNAVAWVAGE